MIEEFLEKLGETLKVFYFLEILFRKGLPIKCFLYKKECNKNQKFLNHHSVASRTQGRISNCAMLQHRSYNSLDLERCQSSMSR